MVSTGRTRRRRHANDVGLGRGREDRHAGPRGTTTSHEVGSAAVIRRSVGSPRRAISRPAGPRHPLVGAGAYRVITRGRFVLSRLGQDKELAVAVRQREHTIYSGHKGCSVIVALVQEAAGQAEGRECGRFAVSRRHSDAANTTVVSSVCWYLMHVLRAVRRFSRCDRIASQHGLRDIIDRLQRCSLVRPTTGSACEAIPLRARDAEESPEVARWKLYSRPALFCHSSRVNSFTGSRRSFAMAEFTGGSSLVTQESKALTTSASSRASASARCTWVCEGRPS
jgi:hypothetical protein